MGKIAKGIWPTMITPFTAENRIDEQALGEMMDMDEKQRLINTVTALNASNYNLVKASQQLHIHKNTLILHLNKIKDLYNINPVQNHDERLLLDYLCYYLKSREWDLWQHIWPQN